MSNQVVLLVVSISSFSLSVALYTPCTVLMLVLVHRHSSGSWKGRMRKVSLSTSPYAGL